MDLHLTRPWSCLSVYLTFKKMIRPPSSSVRSEYIFILILFELKSQNTHNNSLGEGEFKGHLRPMVRSKLHYTIVFFPPTELYTGVIIAIIILKIRLCSNCPLFCTSNLFIFHDFSHVTPNNKSEPPILSKYQCPACATLGQYTPQTVPKKNFF